MPLPRATWASQLLSLLTNTEKTTSPGLSPRPASTAVGPGGRGHGGGLLAAETEEGAAREVPLQGACDLPPAGPLLQVPLTRPLDSSPERVRASGPGVQVGEAGPAGGRGPEASSEESQVSRARGGTEHWTGRAAPGALRPAAGHVLGDEPSLPGRLLHPADALAAHRARRRPQSQDAGPAALGSVSGHRDSAATNISTAGRPALGSCWPAPRLAEGGWACSWVLSAGVSSGLVGPGRPGSAPRGLSGSSARPRRAERREGGRGRGLGSTASGVTSSAFCWPAQGRGQPGF